MSNPTSSVPALPSGGHRRAWWRRAQRTSALARAVAEAARRHDGPLLAITADNHAADRLETDLQVLLEGDAALPVVHFPDWEPLPYDQFSPHPEIVRAGSRPCSGCRRSGWRGDRAGRDPDAAPAADPLHRRQQLRCRGRADARPRRRTPAPADWRLPPWCRRCSIPATTPSAAACSTCSRWARAAVSGGTARRRNRFDPRLRPGNPALARQGRRGAHAARREVPLDRRRRNARWSAARPFRHRHPPQRAVPGPQGRARASRHRAMDAAVLRRNGDAVRLPRRERTTRCSATASSPPADHAWAQATERHEQRRHDIERPAAAGGLWLAPEALRERFNAGPASRSARKAIRASTRRTDRHRAAPELPLAPRGHAPGRPCARSCRAIPAACWSPPIPPAAARRCWK